jgi:hypothetical protein
VRSLLATTTLLVAVLFCEASFPPRHVLGASRAAPACHFPTWSGSMLLQVAFLLVFAIFFPLCGLFFLTFGSATSVFELLVLFALPECSKVGATCRSSFCQTLGSLQLPLSLVLLLDFASRHHFGPAIASVAGQTRVAIALCKCKLQSQYLLPLAISICQIMMLVLLGMLSATAFRCTSLFCVSCLTMSRHEDDHVGLHVGWTLSHAQKRAILS